MGGKNTENGIDIVPESKLYIPVCYECTQALQEDGWTLTYCFLCHRSHLILQERAGNQYRHHVLWLRGCPDCTNTFGGLNFTERSIIPTKTRFLSALMETDCSPDEPCC